MRLAKYKDRVALTISEQEYIAAHRKFGRNAEKLRANCSLIRDTQGKMWVDVRIKPNGSSSFWRQPNGDWSIHWKSVGALSQLPLFGASDVGKFDPDNEGVDLITIPDRIKPVGTDSGKNRRPFEEWPSTKARRSRQAETGRQLIQPDQKSTPETTVDTISTHVSLDQVLEAAAIINVGVKSGFVPIVEDGRITGFQTTTIVKV